MTGNDQNLRIGLTSFILIVAGIPFLLMSGSATVLGGISFGLVVVGIILGLYFVVSVVGFASWLSLGRPPLEPPDDADPWSP